MATTTSSNFGIIGNGFVGTATAAALLESSETVSVTLTHRGKAPKPFFKSILEERMSRAQIDSSRLTWCELELNETSKENVLEPLHLCDAFLLCFPVQTLSAAAKSAVENLLNLEAQVLLLSSTSCYLAESGFVTEETPRLLTHERYSREENFRIQGATLLPLTGLFGNGRDPVDWLKRGMVRDLAGSVNLIHHDDAGFCISALLQAASENALQKSQVEKSVLGRPLAGQVVNVASGSIHRWVDIANAAGLNHLVQGILPRNTHRVVSNDKLLGLLPQLKSHTFQRCPLESQGMVR